MRESSTYQAILEEGRAEGRTEGQVREAQKLLLRQGGKHFGAPDPKTETRVLKIEDLECLEQLAVRLLEVESWQELLSDLLSD